MTQLHAFGDDALGTHDAVGLVQALHRREVSVSEAVEASIARIEAVDPTLGAMALRTYDRARAQARNPHGGWFAGVPTVIKDNADVAGLPTMDGTDAWSPRPAAADGDLARLYLATGVIPVGKSRLSEYGFSASCEHPRLGPVRSPWDLDRTAGASSSGSGALVAAGAVPLAHGNDGGGSIRIPAAVNGLVGLKPTRGRIPTDVINLGAPIKVVCDGVLTRSVRDTAMFHAEAEKIYRHPKLAPVGTVTRPSQRRLRIAFTTDALEGELDPHVAAAVEATAELMADLGHHVERIQIADEPRLAPPSFGDDFVLYWSLLAFAMVADGPRQWGPSFDRTKLDHLTLGLAGQAKRQLHRMPALLNRLRKLTPAAAEFHRRHDVLLTATLGTPTPQLGFLDPTQDFATVIANLRSWVTCTPLQNANGTPSLSLPLATDAAGAPLGMMFSAGHGQEKTLLELGLQVEEAIGFTHLDRAAQAPGHRR